jgi:hypothetical protein
MEYLITIPATFITQHLQMLTTLSLGAKLVARTIMKHKTPA